MGTHIRLHKSTRFNGGSVKTRRVKEKNKDTRKGSSEATNPDIKKEIETERGPVHGNTLKHIQDG